MEKASRPQQQAYPLATDPLPFNNPLLFVIPSEAGFPTSQLSPAPLMWFSSKRTTCVVRSRNSRQEIRGSRGICGAPFGCPKFTVLQPL